MIEEELGDEDDENDISSIGEDVKSLTSAEKSNNEEIEIQSEHTEQEVLPESAVEEETGTTEQDSELDSSDSNRASATNMDVDAQLQPSHPCYGRD